MRKTLFQPHYSPISLTSEEALAFLYDNNFSKHQYLNIRIACKERNADIYPTYYKILKAKLLCRPDGIEVTDKVAKVPLNSIVKHTANRIVLLQENVIQQYMDANNVDICDAKMVFSYGFDGSSGQAKYKQKFDSSIVDCKDYESSLFATTIIPLRLVSSDGHILWNNQTPQSVRFCRPLKLEYTTESKDHILKKKANLDDEISYLENIKIILPTNKVISIQPLLYMTLIDGKVLNILTGTKSNQACPICGSTPIQFRNITNFDEPAFCPKPNTLQYGISPLHSWIRFFECILHISYRSDIKKWQVRGEIEKQQLKEQKNEVQKKFWEKMHLHVDCPKSNGSGSTNDGNTARCAFNHVQLFSEITCVNLELIERFQIILIALTCQYPLDPTLFGSYCIQTAKHYMKHYDWYPMPASVHKVLVHGKQILVNTILPVGYFAEDASESRNKLYKKDREMHARKDSRTHNLTDIINRALDTSDPIISSASLQTRMKKKHSKMFPSEVLEMLLTPEPNQLISNNETNFSPQTSNVIISDGPCSDGDDDEDSDQLKILLQPLDYITLKSQS